MNNRRTVLRNAGFDPTSGVSVKRAHVALTCNYRGQLQVSHSPGQTAAEWRDQDQMQETGSLLDVTMGAEFHEIQGWGVEIS